MNDVAGSEKKNTAWGFAIYIAVLLALICMLPTAALDPNSKKFVLLIGALGIWRYSWGGIHFVRSAYYRRRLFPRWRESAAALPVEALPSHIVVLVTSFRIDSESSTRVYRAAIREAAACGRRATVIASIVESADERLIRRVFEIVDPPRSVDLRFVRIAGTGKRDALALAFNAISRMRLPSDAVVAVVDGDSILPEGGLLDCAALFPLRPRMGALTTDEISEVEGEGFAAHLYRRWYELRFAQRHLLMGSMGLANRVLTLTGRFSMFRADIVTDPRFIARVQHDSIDHWRLGRIDLLTGDDKSTWFHLLSEGWEMAYVPDVLVLTIERPPGEEFFSGATRLMSRWFGNMLRTNARARRISPKTIGLFVWWSLLDQRISMWTSLFGITAAVLTSIFVEPAIMMTYMIWVMFTRLLQTGLLRLVRPNVSIAYPFLLYFNQVYGSMVKVYMLHHLHRQAWTRQGTKRDRKIGDWRLALLERSGGLSLATSAAAYCASVALLIGVVAQDDWLALWRSLTSGL